MFLDMMFSTDPFSHLTTSSIHVFPPSNSFVDHEKDDPYINHHRSNNNPFVSGHCFPTSETLAASKQDLVEGLGLEHYDEYNQIYESEVKKKRASKKDHHSKINTAQGPRDRRVRLSIEVAKKFFYLQDLLGFDKGSKTLDWLFNKSKIQIDELVKRKKETSSSTVTDQSEVVFLETVSDEQGQKKKLVEGKRKKITRIHKSGLPHVNHSRAEARARARERTKEKLNIKKLDKESKAVHGESCPNSTFQSSFWSAIESQNHYNDKFEESIMEEKIQTLYSYQHNLTVSNDLSSKLTGLPRFTAVAEQQGDHTTI